MLKRYKQIFVLVGCAVITVVTLLIVWAVQVHTIRQSHVPPDGVNSFSDYMARMPKPQSLHLSQSGNDAYLVATGDVPIAMLLTAPSGPPEYVFDRSGVLVDWTMDRGDDGSYQSRWPNTRFVRTLTAQEANDWIE
jgi:hypothetical protein